MHVILHCSCSVLWYGDRAEVGNRAFCARHDLQEIRATLPGRALHACAGDASQLLLGVRDLLATDDQLGALEALGVLAAATEGRHSCLERAITSVLEHGISASAICGALVGGGLSQGEVARLLLVAGVPHETVNDALARSGVTP